MMRGRCAYALLTYLALPFVLVRLWLRGRKEPGYRRHVGERLGRYRTPVEQGCMWLHAVSVGETRAAQPIVERLLARYPDRRLLVTHMTPTGRATGEQLYGDRVMRCYLPYDFPGAVERFLDHYRPALGLVMETEIWFNLVHACRRRNIPLHLVNARLSEKSAAGYARIPKLAREGFNALASIAAQTQSDARRFEALGANNVLVVGNVKFDIAPDADLSARGVEWRAAWGATRPVWLAASTREGEEAMLLDVLDGIDVPHALAVIVPRHPQRFAEVAALLEARGISYRRRSENAPPDAATRVLLGDSMGEMGAYYAACDVAFIGGSLRPYGAHNLLEACALGKAVIVGPSVFNFQEATESGVAAGAVLQVADAQELTQQVSALLRDPARRTRMGEAGVEFTRSHRGAVDRLFALLGL